MSSSDQSALSTASVQAPSPMCDICGDHVATSQFRRYHCSEECEAQDRLMFEHNVAMVTSPASSSSLPTAMVEVDAPEEVTTVSEPIPIAPSLATMAVGAPFELDSTNDRRADRRTVTLYQNAVRVLEEFDLKAGTTRVQVLSQPDVQDLRVDMMNGPFAIKRTLRLAANFDVVRVMDKKGREIQRVDGDFIGLMGDDLNIAKIMTPDGNVVIVRPSDQTTMQVSATDQERIIAILEPVTDDDDGEEAKQEQEQKKEGEDEEAKDTSGILLVRYALPMVKWDFVYTLLVRPGQAMRGAYGEMEVPTQIGGIGRLALPASLAPISELRIIHQNLRGARSSVVDATDRDAPTPTYSIRRVALTTPRKSNAPQGAAEMDENGQKSNRLQSDEEVSTLPFTTGGMGPFKDVMPELDQTRPQALGNPGLQLPMWKKEKQLVVRQIVYFAMTSFSGDLTPRQRLVFPTGVQEMQPGLLEIVSTDGPALIENASFPPSPLRPYIDVSDHPSLNARTRILSQDAEAQSTTARFEVHNSSDALIQIEIWINFARQAQMSTDAPEKFTTPVTPMRDSTVSSSALIRLPIGIKPGRHQWDIRWFK